MVLVWVGQRGRCTHEGNSDMASDVARCFWWSVDSQISQAAACEQFSVRWHCRTLNPVQARIELAEPRH